MWELEKIHKYLKENLSKGRYLHTLGVVETAKKLAEANGEDSNKAELAALVHDMAKQMPIEEQIKVLRNNNVQITQLEEKSPQILHGFVGAILAKQVIGIEDCQVLNAVAYHTTAKKNMTKLEKIIYIADYIEPNRNYPGVEELRKITFDNLDYGVLKGLENTIIFVIQQGELVHPTTLEARNQILIDIKNKM